jgi:hypothetical protein
MAHEEQPNLIEVIVVPPNEVTVVEEINVVEVNENAPTEVKISTIGIQGALGPTGPQGVTGPVGPTGVIGPPGFGTPTGGITFDLLQKRSDADHDNEWTTTPTVSSLRVANQDSFFQTALITAETETTNNLTLDVSEADSVKYMVRVSSGNNALTTEIVATALGETVNFTEYGTVVVGAAPCSFDVTRNDENISLICTPTTGTLTHYRVVKHTITG